MVSVGERGEGTQLGGVRDGWIFIWIHSLGLRMGKKLLLNLILMPSDLIRPIGDVHGVRELMIPYHEEILGSFPDHMGYSDIVVAI